VRRNRRRYGGYTVHAGLAVLLVGVAASSSFQRSHDVTLRPGQAAVVDGYRFTYVRPTEVASSQKIQFGALLAVSRGPHRVVTLNTARGYYPDQNPSDGMIGRFFDGEADSNVGLDAGLTRDIWAVVNPGAITQGPLGASISKGDRLFRTAIVSAMPRLARLSPARQRQALSQIYAYRDVAVAGIAHGYVAHPYPVEFLLIVSPLVSWIWIGAIIIACGGLIALWPVPVLARRRSLAVYRARLARELAA
jgi:cytochrome c-type biogenesis protein CcmF